MKIKLTVEVDGLLWGGGAVAVVPELMVETFEPLRTGDDRMIGILTGESTEDQARLVIKKRENAAKILSAQLTEMIMKEMSRKDTHNGYYKHVEG